MTDAAALLGAVGALLLVLARSRSALLGGLAAIAAAELALAVDLLPGGLSRLGSAEGAAAAALALPALALGAALLVRYPGVVPVVLVAAAPFRLPLEFGTDKTLFIGLGDPGSLGRLLPLYALVAAAAAALAWRTFRGEEPRILPPALAIPTALLVALMTASLLWAYDLPAARDRVAFFILPFVTLLAVVARAPYRPWLPRALALTAVSLACVFAAVGLAEAWVRELIFYEPKVAVANSYTSYFRVTSLFSDPSIYGRHLVLAMAIVLVALWLARVPLLVGAGLLALLWAGLFFSYSQSSMVALVVVAVVVSYVVADRRTRRTLALAAAGLALVGAIALLALLRTESIDRVTSNRSTLVRGTATVFANHPVAGVGIASQPAATRDEANGARHAERNVSHTTPLTIAAELGLMGLVLYAAFLTGVVRLLRTATRSVDAALGLAVLAVVVVLFVHSLFYALFFDDPLLWAALGVAAAALAAREQAVPAPARAVRRTAPAPAPAPR